MTAKTTQPVTITWDPDASTRYHQVYRAPSRTHAHITYKVVHDTETGTIRCECPHHTYARQCAHTAAARDFATRRWWAGLWSDYDMGALLDADRVYALRDTEGTLTPEDRTAWYELGAVIGERLGEVA